MNLNKTKGQLEAEISNAITQFEKEHMGRGPQETRTFIIQDMVLIRLRGVLTPAEEKLSQDEEGARLIKQVRMQLIQTSRALIEDLIVKLTGGTVLNIHTDISALTGERVFVISLAGNLEDRLKNHG